MNLKTLSVVSTAILFACSPMVAQQKRPSPPARDSQPQNHTPDSFVPDKPKSCVEFDQMAARVDAVTSIEEITADDFAAAAAQPKAIIRNPGKVFDVENVEYIAQPDGERTTYTKFTTHKDKESEFLKWYNHEGQGEMSYTALKCSSQYIGQVLNSTDKGTQRLLLFQQQQMWMTLSQATSIARAADDEMFREALEWGSAGFQETMRLKDRYNKLVENVNAYNDAVNNLVATVNSILNERKTSRPAPTFNFNFVRPQPITCTGNTFAFSNSTAYFNNLDTVTNATTRIRCE